MDLRQLECFLKVAEHLHFGRAAEELYLGQPTVSEAIRRLERDVGGPLFERTTRRVTLTPLGEAFLAEARPAFEGVQRAYERGRSLAQQQALEFHLGYTGELGEDLLDAIAALQTEAPGVLVSLRAMSTGRQVRAVQEGRLHAAIGWVPELGPDLDSLLLGTATLVAVVPASHALAEQDVTSLAEIAHEPLIAWPRSANAVTYDRFAEAMDATGVPWTLVGTAAGADTVAARVLSGFGIGVLFESFAEVRPLEGLAYVPVKDEDPVIERMLFWRRDQHHVALPAFRELMSNRFRGGDAR